MASGMDDRTTRVLRHIVEDYISTAEPVGSRTISKKMGSPSRPRRSATSWRTSRRPGSSPNRTPPRAHPHGRRFRYYIDHLLARQALARARWTSCTARRAKGTSGDELVRQVSRLLSNLARQASVVVVSSPEQQVLSSVSLMRAGSRGSFWSP